MVNVLNLGNVNPPKKDTGATEAPIKPQEKSLGKE